MAAMVLDASVILAALLPQEVDAERASMLLRRVQREGATAPGLWPTEVLNGLLVATRRQRIGQGEMASALALVATLNVGLVHPKDAPAAWEGALRLAVAHRLTAYDAAYLALSIEAGLPLATFDRDLRRAASAEGVPLLP